MTNLESRIRRAIADEQWTFTNHAEQRLNERDIEGWQVIAGVEAGQTIEVVPSALPNPKIVIR